MSSFQKDVNRMRAWDLVDALLAALGIAMLVGGAAGLLMALSP